MSLDFIPVLQRLWATPSEELSTSSGHFRKLGRGGRVAGTREYVIVGTPYLIICSFAGDVQIARLLHGAQQWPPDA